MSRLRIASHNVFWFQGRPFPTTSPGEAHAPILEALVAIYRELDPTLLCLQELQNDATGRKVEQALGMRSCYTRGSELPQYGIASFGKLGRAAGDSLASSNAPPQRAWQRIALTLAARRKAPSPYPLPQGERGNNSMSFNRPLAEGGEFVVAHCHLPSGRQIPEALAARRRIGEMRAALDGSPKPHVVLGDFNEQPGGGLGDFLREQGYRDAALATGSARLPTTPKGRRGDQIWICEALVSKLSGYGVLPEERMRASHLGKEHLSDHFPLWVDLDLEIVR